LRLYHLAIPHLVRSTLAEHVTHLDLTILPSTGVGSVAALVPLAKNLQVLRLTFLHDYDFSVADLDALGSMARLTDLRLLYAPHLTNASMEQLARGWSRLERFELALHPPDFTPLALRHRALHCPQLQHLVIAGLRLNMFALAGRQEPMLDDEDELLPPPRLPLLELRPIFRELRHLHLQTAGRPRLHEK
jgi:hypothetical protein